MKKINYVFFSFIIISIAFSSNALSLISFNIHGFGGARNNNKVLKIVESIDNHNIICIQENWKYIHIFKDKLERFDFIFSDQIKNKHIFSSGLTTGFDKSINIVEYDLKNYNTCNGYIFNGSDCFASKGFIYTRISYNNTFLNIYNTHLDAGMSKKDKIVRESQLLQLKNYIIKRNSNDPIIICGDFNIDFYSKEKNKIIKFLDELDLKFLEWDSKYFLKNKIDYIFYRNIDVIQNDSMLDTLFYLSDHPPMNLSFIFKE